MNTVKNYLALMHNMFKCLITNKDINISIDYQTGINDRNMIRDS